MQTVPNCEIYSKFEETKRATNGTEFVVLSIMDSKLMCLLTVNGNKHKLIIDTREKCVPFSVFKSHVDNKLSHLSFIFDKNYILEVYDADFQEYIKVEKYDFIEHMSRLRAVSHSPDGEHSREDYQNSGVTEAINLLTASSTPSTAVVANRDDKNEQKATVNNANSDHNSFPNSTSLPEKAVRTKRIYRRRRKRRTSKSSVGSVNSMKSERSLLASEEHKFTSEASDRSTSSRLQLTQKQPSSVKVRSINPSNSVFERDINTLNFTSRNTDVDLKTANSKTGIRVPASRNCSQGKDISTILNKGKVVFEEFGKVCLYESDFKVNDISSCYAICEVLCKFNRYFCEHDNAWEADDVWDEAATHLSQFAKVRVSTASLKEKFSHLLSQYTKIIMYLVGWDEDDCSNLWPLFPIFHYELILIPFRNDIEHLVRNFNNHSKKNTKFSLRSLANNKSTDENFSIFNVLKGKKLLPRKKAPDNPVDEDLQLLDAVKKHQWEFKNNRKLVTVVWDKIQYEMNKRSTRSFTALECRQRFELLLNQYTTMLTFMKEFSFEQCQQLWPLFASFHFEIDYHFINQKILHLKQEFDECEKLEDELSSGQKVIDEIIDETEIELKLVASIRDHIESLMNKCINEDDFWQKIAYDLSFYETPVENSSKHRWQLMFCGVVDKYMRGESKNERLNGDLHQILERIYDITTD